LIKTLLQAERHDELLLWNSNKGPTGSKPLSKVHANTHNRKQKGVIQNGNPKTSNAKNKRKRRNKPHSAKGKDNSKASFGCADKPTEKHCWLICYERKTLFWLKNKLKSSDYKPDEQNLSPTETSPKLVRGVVATTTRLRSVAPQSTWWNYT
jgi:hypothetical protein